MLAGIQNEGADLVKVFVLTFLALSDLFQYDPYVQVDSPSSKLY